MRKGWGDSKKNKARKLKDADGLHHLHRFLRASANLEVEEPERDVLNDLLRHILGVELGSVNQAVRC